MLNSNSNVRIIFITFSHIINMRIGSNFMVINTPVKVVSLNPFFVLISMIKIFTINGSMINIVFIFIFSYWKCKGFTLMCTKLIFISIAKFVLNCCWCFLKRGCIASQCGALIIQDCKLQRCSCLYNFLYAYFCTWLQSEIQLKICYLFPFMHLAKHDLHMFVFCYHHISVINALIEDFMWRTESNIYVMQSRVHLQVFHNFYFQIIQGLQLTAYHHIVALDIRTLKWESIIRVDIAKGSTVVYIYMDHCQPIDQVQLCQ